MDWESLKFFLAVAREGTLAGAGRALGVKHSTVLRRVAALESGLGIRLFERHPNGYLLTDAGREMLDSSVPVEEELFSLERRLSGRDLRLTGTVRLATLSTLGPWICRALAGFRLRHPGIRVEVSASIATANLARYEADVAVRVSRNPPDGLVGRRIAPLSHGVYVAATHPAAASQTPDLAVQDWVGYDDSRADLPPARWLQERVPADRVVLRTNDTAMMIAAAQAGLGMAVLPCYLGDSAPGLRRIVAITGLGLDLWILTHRDLRRTPRIRALTDFLAKELVQYRDLISGLGRPSADSEVGG
ncbi:MAG: LysR family transcriptional regulator [Magnetospirillum sp.]|nr:LysR family transcriptional regulator [Magnetospirillum sp.]